MITPSLTQDAPIGIFDSGVGGLTVLRHLQRLLPNEAVIYLADTANVPYGDKPLSVVRDLALSLTAHLINQGAKLVIMASGTSTAAGLEAARTRYSHIPILGTIDPGARTAVQLSQDPIGVLSTNATAKSLAFTNAIRRLDPGRRVIEQGCPRFVPLVEAGLAESNDALDAAHEYLTPLLRVGIRSIIFGCTHFPFLQSALTKVAEAQNARIHFIDPAEEAICEAIEILAAADLLALQPPLSECRLRLAASGNPAIFTEHAASLLRISLPAATQLTL